MQSRREFVRVSAAWGTALKTGSLVGAAALPFVALLCPAGPSPTAAQEGGAAVQVEATVEIKRESSAVAGTDGRHFYSCMDRDLPISKVVVAGDYLYTFGDGEPFDIKDPKPGMRVLFERMQAMLRERGATFADVVKVTALLNGPGIWKEYCDVYGEYFKPPYPCRTTIPVVGDAPFLELDFVVYKKGLAELPCNSAEAARESMRPRPAGAEKPR